MEPLFCSIRVYLSIFYLLFGKLVFLSFDDLFVFCLFCIQLDLYRSKNICIMNLYTCHEVWKNMVIEKSFRVTSFGKTFKTFVIKSLTKIFLQVQHLKVCESFLFRQGNKTWSILWPACTCLHFWRRKDQINTVYEK